MARGALTFATHAGTPPRAKLANAVGVKNPPANAGGSDMARGALTPAKSANAVFH
jgi:hypothetical protein